MSLFSVFTLLGGVVDIIELLVKRELSSREALL